MELLKRLKQYSEERADVVAFKNAFSEETITYGQLWSYSNKIAARIRATIDDDKKPVVVYGHKAPEMLATFLACVKTGHPYCPVDISMPKERLIDIVEASQTKLLIAIEDTEVSAEHKFTFADVKNTIAEETDAELSEQGFVSGDDVYYIIFTSGSTGKPKGVMITANCLDNYLY
jgi:D-alanine--poly(phosphoribitol) ligase subunit 1